MTEEVNFYFSFKWRVWLVTCYWTVHLCRMADADVRRIIGLDVWVEPTWFPPPPIPTPPLPLPWIVMWAGDKQLFAMACEGYCLTSWLPWLTWTCVLATTFLKKGQFSLLLIHFRSSRNARGLCWDLVFKALIILFKRWKKWLCGPESKWFHLAPWPYTIAWLYARWKVHCSKLSSSFFFFYNCFKLCLSCSRQRKGHLVWWFFGLEERTRKTSISFNTQETWFSAEEEMNSISRRILPGRSQIDHALWRVLSGAVNTILTLLLVVSKVRQWCIAGAGQLISPSLVSSERESSKFPCKARWARMAWTISPALCACLILGEAPDFLLCCKENQLWNQTDLYQNLNSVTCCLVSKSCLTLCGSMDCTPPGFSVHGMFQARILEWVVIVLLGIFLTQGSNPHLLHWQEDSLALSLQGSPCHLLA